MLLVILLLPQPLGQGAIGFHPPVLVTSHRLCEGKGGTAGPEGPGSSGGRETGRDREDVQIKDKGGEAVRGLS